MEKQHDNTNCHKNCVYLNKEVEMCLIYNETLDFGDNNDDTFVKCEECIESEKREANNGNNK